MSSHAYRARLVSACALIALIAGSAHAETATTTLPEVKVTATQAGALTVPTTAEARELIERTAGSVSLVPDTRWRETQATTLKDVLDYTPGVFAQPKWGEDTRLSIRGSGLARNFHLRGVMLLQNGMPLNNADGSGDFQELDPTAYRYAEVYKGGNALRFGANSLGGAINFVTPTGRDAPELVTRGDVGSFGFWRAQAQVGTVAGNVDAFITGSQMRQDGFRDHSDGHSTRASGNIGYRLSDNAETRFFANAVTLNQKIPGSLTRGQALSTPKMANATNTRLKYQRNMESIRLGNRTVVDLGPTQVEFGGYYNVKHLIHPIFQYLDYQYRDYGVFGRVGDERDIAGHANRFTLGVNLGGGTVDGKNYVNTGGAKGALVSHTLTTAVNTVVYAEDAFDIVKDFAFVLGGQYQHNKRERDDKLASPGTSGSQDYGMFSPRVGLLWTIDPGWRAFANVTRSFEPPTLSELNFTNASLSDVRPQRATTYEIGTTGQRDDVNWDVTLYHSRLRNEFQFFDLGGGNVQVTNAAKTIHQGLELGGGVAVLKGLTAAGSDPDKLWFNLAYTYSDFRFDGDPTWGNNDLPGAPKHMVRAELMYHHPSGFHLGPNVEWVPQAYYVDNANTTKTDSYALLGFKAGYDINDRVSVHLDARNLTDEKYIASASTAATATANSALFEPGTGRAVFVGARIKW